MQTDKIIVKNSGEGAVEALEETSKFATYVGLSEKDTLRLRLIAEETLGMVNVISGSFEGEFWLETKKDKTCLIHLVTNTEMDAEKRKAFIDASTDKKNASAVGIMGKIREMIESSIYSMEDAADIQSNYGNVLLSYGTMGVNEMDMSTMSSCMYQWSLEKYRQDIENASTEGEDETIEEAWDELEKSIVASIADDIKVGVSGNRVEMIIEKKF